MTLAHAIDGSPGAWELDPLVLLLSIGAAAAYGRGVYLLSKRRSARTPSIGRRVGFYGGLVIAAGAVISPLHGWSETLFAAHMTQHLLLVIVAAPLLVLGRPSAPLIAALPSNVGKAASLLFVTVRKRAPFLLHPVSLWALHAFVLWAWHLPTLYDLALENTFMHGLEHATFLGSALLVWAAVFGERPIGEGASVLLLFATGLQSAALGALLALATQVLYDSHAVAAPIAGFDPLTDQQLAGVIMWIPPGILYLAVSALMLSRLLQDTSPRIEEAGRP
jgi:cytochrome c oxidase assembly factor CtaG